MIPVKLLCPVDMPVGRCGTLSNIGSVYKQWGDNCAADRLFITLMFAA
jgi:hypothetical protein